MKSAAFALLEPLAAWPCVVHEHDPNLESADSDSDSGSGSGSGSDSAHARAAAPTADESLPSDPALDTLVDLYWHRVGYFARRIERRFGLDPSGRDDLMSAGYWGLLKALRNRREDAHEHELSAYVSKRVEGAVIDEARMALRRASNYSHCDLEELETGLPHESCNADWVAGQASADPEEWVDLRGRWRTIEASFDHLSMEHRKLLMAYAAGRSLAEIARSAGSNPAYLQNQMSRICRSIRAQSPELRRLLRFEI